MITETPKKEKKNRGVNLFSTRNRREWRAMKTGRRAKRLYYSIDHDMRTARRQLAMIEKHRYPYAIFNKE